MGLQTLIPKCFSLIVGGICAVLIQVTATNDTHCLEQVATVMVAIARIAAAAEVDPSYLPAGANVHYVVALSHTSLPPPKGISVVFSVFVTLTWQKAHRYFVNLIN